MSAFDFNGALTQSLASEQKQSAELNDEINKQSVRLKTDTAKASAQRTN